MFHCHLSGAIDHFFTEARTGPCKAAWTTGQQGGIPETRLGFRSIGVCFVNGIHMGQIEQTWLSAEVFALLGPRANGPV
jgi:hypothetical protein